MKEGSIKVANTVLGDEMGAESKAEATSVQVQVTAGSGEPTTGDVNEDGKVSIGDLGIIAAHYGLDSTSPDWSQIKRADVNGDGKIDLLDLAAVARKISG